MDNNVTPIAEAIESKKPGPKPRAEIIQQCRERIQGRSSEIVEAAIADVARLVPGNPGCTERLYWLAGQIRVAAHMNDSASDILPPVG